MCSGDVTTKNGCIQIDPIWCLNCALNPTWPKPDSCSSHTPGLLMFPIYLSGKPEIKESPLIYSLQSYTQSTSNASSPKYLTNPSISLQLQAATITPYLNCSNSHLNPSPYPTLLPSQNPALSTSCSHCSQNGLFVITDTQQIKNTSTDSLCTQDKDPNPLE